MFFFSLQQWFSVGDNYTFRGHLMFEDVFSSHRWGKCYWYLLRRRQGCCPAPPPPPLPMTRNYSTLNVSSARLRNSALGPIAFCFSMKNTYCSLAILHSPFYPLYWDGSVHLCLQRGILCFIDSHQFYFHFLSLHYWKSSGMHHLEYYSCKVYLLSHISDP